MHCINCGNENHEGSIFCNTCGKRNDGVAVSDTASAVLSPDENAMTFGRAIITCLTKYSDFNGKASRSEFWWFALFTAIVLVASYVLIDSVKVAILICLALAIPVFTAATRRLHDINRSGWWHLIALTGVGAVLLLIWLSTEGKRESLTKSEVYDSSKKNVSSGYKVLVWGLGSSVMINVVFGAALYSLYTGSHGETSDNPGVVAFLKSITGIQTDGTFNNEQSQQQSESQPQHQPLSLCDELKQQEADAKSQCKAGRISSCQDSTSIRVARRMEGCQDY
jgi:hypothetical protein